VRAVTITPAGDAHRCLQFRRSLPLFTSMHAVRCFCDKHSQEYCIARMQRNYMSNNMSGSRLLFPALCIACGIQGSRVDRCDVRRAAWMMLGRLRRQAENAGALASDGRAIQV
jgi:hypothetical protein